MLFLVALPMRERTSFTLLKTLSIGGLALALLPVDLVRQSGRLKLVRVVGYLVSGAIVLAALWTVAAPWHYPVRHYIAHMAHGPSEPWPVVSEDPPGLLSALNGRLARIARWQRPKKGGPEVERVSYAKVPLVLHRSPDASSIVAGIVWPPTAVSIKKQTRNGWILVSADEHAGWIQGAPGSLGLRGPLVYVEVVPGVRAARVRTGPSKRASVVTVIHPGVRYRFVRTSSRGGWICLALPGGGGGWTARYLLQLTFP
jgi:hypothetical protein